MWEHRFQNIVEVTLFCDLSLKNYNSHSLQQADKGKVLFKGSELK